MVKKIILSTLLLLAVLGYFFLNQYDPHVQKVFEPLDTPTIPFSEDRKLYFFSSGFVISDNERSLFYDFEGNPIEAPLDRGDKSLELENITVTDSTDNYMVINHKYLYNISKMPFKFIVESPQDGVWDIKEFDNSLLLVARRSDDELEPYIIEKADHSLHRIDGLGGLSYIDSDWSQSSNALSLIALDKDSPTLSSEVLHFIDTNQPYGVLSEAEEIFYKIFRFEDFFVVMGLHNIKCYDMMGDLKWEKNIPNIIDHQQLTIDRELALYFNNIYVEGQNNTIVITDKGKYHLTSLPRGIHHLTRYKNRYIGVLDKRNLVILSSKGAIAERYEMDTQIHGVYWTSHAPDNVFLNTGDELYIYSIKTQNERS